MTTKHLGNRHQLPLIKTVRRFFRISGKENNKGIERPCICISIIFYFTVCFFPDSKVLFQNEQSFDDWCLFRILTKEMYFRGLWGFAVLTQTKNQFPGSTGGKCLKSQWNHLDAPINLLMERLMKSIKWSEDSSKHPFCLLALSHVGSNYFNRKFNNKRKLGFYQAFKVLCTHYFPKL